MFAKVSLARHLDRGKVDVLLVYPIWITQAGRGKLQRMLPPLGILSIASFLEKNGLTVHILDLHAEAIGPGDFRKIVARLSPRFVGITVLSNHFIPAHHIAKICKDEIPDSVVVVGGVHAEAYPEQMLINPAINAVCRGDGEETMLEIVHGKPFDQILGLSFRKGDRVVHNGPRAISEDLDQFPFPAYHLIQFDHYFPAVGTYRNFPAINALMTRGCPGKCTFCNSAKTKLRGRSPQKMVELIEMLRSKHGIRQISFYDDTFTADPKNVREFCKLLIEKKMDITFVCYARGDMFSDEMAQLLSKAGCHQVLLGIESGSLAIMEKIGKKIDHTKYKKVVDTAHKYGIEVRGAFIIGHVEETQQTLEDTLKFAIDLDIDFFQPSILTPYPGTQLFQEAKSKGLLLHENYDLYGQGEVILKMENLSSEDLLSFYYWCFIRFYFRPKAVWKQLKRLRNFRQCLDLAKSFYVILIEGLQRDRNADLRGWLAFDPYQNAIPIPYNPNQSRLTYEVRQSATFN